MASKARRGRGEGSIFQRASDGRFVGVVDLGRIDGKRQRKVVYGATRREVADALKKVLRDQQLGTLPTGPNQTVGQFLRGWLATYVKPGTRPKTYETYAGLVEQHLIPSIGAIRLDKLTPDHVQAMLNAKAQTKLSRRTVFHLRAVLRTALNRAIRNGLIARNVAALTDPPKVERAELGFLSPAEAKRLLAASTGRERALYHLTLATGLRQGEALGLRWSDVDLDGGSLTVSHALQRIGGQHVLVQPKTTRSRRTVPLPSPVVDSLRQLRREQTAMRLRAGSKWQDFDLVFCTDHGTALDGPTVTRSFQRALAAAELRRIRFHDLRHSAASILLAEGTPMRVVMELLGHSTITLTANTYSHVMPAALREAADAMERALGS